MKQWGFYFNQDRCLDCKTCILACKQWNEEKRGDAAINLLPYDVADVDKKYSVELNKAEPGTNFINAQTGETNYKEYRKYYMKEMWRRVEETQTGYTKLNDDNSFETTFDRSYLSISCNHCSEPYCVEACPVGRIYKDKDTGIVYANPDQECISCKSCKNSCPWGAPQFFDEHFKELKDLNLKAPMTKCNLCIDRLYEGKKPACVAACWNRALDAAPMDELKKRYPDAVDKIAGFTPKPCKPNIIFKAKTNNLK